MQHLKQDEYPFDPSLEDGRTPSETSSADEFAFLPDETVFTAPEDSAAEEFVSGVRSKEEDGEKTSPLLLQKLAFFFVTAFAMMSVGNAAGAYFMNGLENQTPLAQEGIRWLVCVIPAFLLGLAMWIISRYPLTDELVDKINREIESRD